LPYGLSGAYKRSVDYPLEGIAGPNLLGKRYGGCQSTLASGGDSVRVRNASPSISFAPSGKSTARSGRANVPSGFHELATLQQGDFAKRAYPILQPRETNT
jgi:hypothetical protein